MPEFIFKSSFFLFLFFSLVSVKGQEILLPDQVYTIKVIEKNSTVKTEGQPEDELFLKANRISATFTTKKGFPPAAYSLSQDSTTNRNVLKFTAESAKDSNQTLKWSGTIDGLSIQGKAQLFYFGKVAVEYVFTGVLKKKK
jgi:hypothetical protein